MRSKDQKAICLLYGSEVNTVLNHSDIGNVSSLNENYILLSFEKRIILLTSNPNLLGPFSIILNFKNFIDLFMTILPGDRVSISKNKNRILFDNISFSINISPQKISNLTYELKDEALKLTDILYLNSFLLSFFKIHLNSIKWEPTLLKNKISFNNHSLPIFILIMTYSFSFPNQEDKEKIKESLEGFQKFIINFFHKNGWNISPYKNLDFEIDSPALVIKELLSSRALSSNNILNLSSSENFLLGYLEGFFLGSSPKKVLTDPSYLMLNTLIWGKLSPISSPLFKENFYYLCKGKSFIELKKLENLIKSENNHNLFQVFEEFTLKESPLNIEFLIGIFFKLLEESYDKTLEFQGKKNYLKKNILK